MASKPNKLSPPDPAFVMTGLIRIRDIPNVRQSRNRLFLLLTDIASKKFGTIACLELFGSTGMLCYYNMDFNDDAVENLNKLRIVFEGSHLLFEPWFEVYAAPLSPDERKVIKDQSSTVEIYNRREIEESQSSKYKASKTSNTSRPPAPAPTKASTSRPPAPARAG